MKYTKMRNARAELLLFLIEYAFLWRFGSRRRCLKVPTYCVLQGIRSNTGETVVKNSNVS